MKKVKTAQNLETVHTHTHTHTHTQVVLENKKELH